MSENKDAPFKPELQATGDTVARLRRSVAPRDLIARTLERASLIKPLRKKLLILRPITHPLARIAAVVMLMAMTVPLTDLDVVDAVGNRIEHNVVGTNVMNHVENLVDGIVPEFNTAGYSQNELDGFTGVRNSPSRPSKLKGRKTRSMSRV